MNKDFTRIYKNLCKKLGENNDALYGVLTIAASKGILRPTFTMMDKKQDKKSRQYTAFREATTGAVAFGSYILTHKGVEKLIKPICKKANILGKENEVKTTLSLITVSLTALFVIPFICNKITKPLMDVFVGKKNQNKPDIKKTNIQPNSSGTSKMRKNYYYKPITKPVFVNSGMRIGG